MVPIKIVFTVLGLCAVCSRTAPNNPTLMSKLLTQSEDKDVKIHVRRNAVDGLSNQNLYYIPSSRKPRNDTLSRILKGILLKEQLRTININNEMLSSKIATPGANSEDASAVQVSPNVHSDYLHIENYIPTFITIPCDSRSCSQQSSVNSNSQILSDIQSNSPSLNSIHCPQHASSLGAGDHSYIISEAPAVNLPSTDYILSNTNEGIALLDGTSVDNLSDTEFSELLQSEIQNSNSHLIEKEHFVTPEQPLLPSTLLHSESHATDYEIVKDAINADSHDSDHYHKFAEFTSYPHLSTANDEIITPGIETYQPLNPPSPFESTVSIPEPPAYFPQNTSYTDTVDLSESEYTSHSTFENQPIVVIPEAPVYIPLNPPNISYNLSQENTAADEFMQTIHSDYSDTSNSEHVSQAEEIIEIPNTSDVQINLGLNPTNPIEPTILIPEPPIYFPLNPLDSNTAGQSGTGEIVSLLDNYESSYTIAIPENTPSPIDSLPIIVIAPELTQTVHSDYSNLFYPEIVTDPEEIVENTYVAVPPAPALMPLNPPNITFSLTDTSYSSENINSVLVSAQLSNFSSTVENNSPNTEYTIIDHAHLITSDDSPNLLISHYLNSQNHNIAPETFESTSSSDLTTTSLQPIDNPETLELKPLTPTPSPIISLDDSIHSYNQNNNDEVIHYDNESEKWSLDSIKIPESPLLVPINAPYTNSPDNPITTLNHSLENEVIQSSDAAYNNEVLTLSLNNQYSTANSDPTLEESQSKSENTPLNILLSMSQQITLPHILKNSNVVVMSNNHNTIHGQNEHLVSSSPEYSSSVHEDSEPLSIVQDSNIVVSSSPITVEKTNEIVSQLDSTIQNLKLHNKGIQIQRNFKDLPPCESEKPVDGVMTNVFEPKKCKQEVKEWSTNSSSKQSTSKHSRRRKVVVRNRKSKITNVTKNN